MCGSPKDSDAILSRRSKMQRQTLYDLGEMDEGCACVAQQHTEIAMQGPTSARNDAPLPFSSLSLQHAVAPSRGTLPQARTASPNAPTTLIPVASAVAGEDPFGAHAARAVMYGSDLG